MRSDEEFEIPLKFIEENKKNLVQNDNTQQNYKMKGLIDDLYANYNFQQYKSTKSNKTSQKFHTDKPNSRRTKFQQQQSQESKRQQQIKTLIRSSNLKEKLLLDTMNRKQHIKVDRQKNRIKRRLSKGIDLQGPHDNLQHVDIINVEQQQKPQKQLKGVTYIDKNKLKYNESHKNHNTEQHEAQVIETNNFNKPYNLVPFGESYLDNTGMYELNKPIYEKQTYRFNVLWWEKDKLTQQQRKHVQLDKDSEIQDGKFLDNQVIKQLKKHLKPLRRHKLVSTKYAPLAQFMPGPQGTLQKDGIQNGRMIETSSEDDMELYQEYDRKVNEDNNPPGAINLQDSQTKRKRKTRKGEQKESELSKLLRKSKQKDKKTQYPFQNDQIQNKLKRALRKMNDNGWEEDKLLCRGTQQEKPIEIQ